MHCEQQALKGTRGQRKETHFGHRSLLEEQCEGVRYTRETFLLPEKEI